MIDLEKTGKMRTISLTLEEISIPSIHYCLAMILCSTLPLDEEGHINTGTIPAPSRSRMWYTLQLHLNVGL